MKVKKWPTVLAAIVVLVVGVLGGAVGDRLLGDSWLDKWLPRKNKIVDEQREVIREVLQEENAVIRVVEEVTPSVVTVGVKKTQKIIDSSSLFDPFGFFGRPRTQPEVEERQIEQNIGSGFIIDASGLIVTNKHVVDDGSAEYRVITYQDDELKVEKIYRDPINDMAILKVSPPASGLKPVRLGDSSNLRVGQVVIAIGTALGEFRSTVTTGVISGLGRGINAGSPFGGLSERLDDVIQTDAAINPGNSGGPLLNSSSEVIGVSVAISQAGENIGFAIPINLVKESIETFNTTGKFSRPFLGVRYQMLDKRTAILNSVPQGAYIVEIVTDSPADKAGVKENDIIIKIDDRQLDEDNGLAELISKKKVGGEASLEIYRNGEEIKLKVKLEEAGE
jgi:S1-C subfamily serine protease